MRCSHGVHSLKRLHAGTKHKSSFFSCFFIFSQSAAPRVHKLTPTVCERNKDPLLPWRFESLKNEGKDTPPSFFNMKGKKTYSTRCRLAARRLTMIKFSAVGRFTLISLHSRTQGSPSAHAGDGVWWRASVFSRARKQSRGHCFELIKHQNSGTLFYTRLTYCGVVVCAITFCSVFFQDGGPLLAWLLSAVSAAWFSLESAPTEASLLSVE